MIEGDSTLTNLACHELPLADIIVHVSAPNTHIYGETAQWYIFWHAYFPCFL